MDNSRSDNKDFIIGCLLGGAIGDALGYQCEFVHGVKEREFTAYADDYGMFSDDTQMTLFTANALLWYKTHSALNEMPLPEIACIQRAYHDWYGTQNNLQPGPQNVSWIDKLDFIRHRRAPGFTCLNALSNTDANKYGTIKDPINQSKGCGGAMRVAPVGFFADSLKDAVELSAESAALTHGHPLGIIPAAFVGGLIYELVHDRARDLNGQLHLAFEYTNQFATQQFYRQYQDDFMAIMHKTFDLSRNSARDLDNIREIGEGWTAEEAVAIAVYCCLRYPDNFEDAIITSINHDGDSDSTGSIAGNIIGARLGINAIPAYYIDHIEHKQFLLDFATDCTNCQQERIRSLAPDDAWFVKYDQRNPDKEYR